MRNLVARTTGSAFIPILVSVIAAMLLGAVILTLTGAAPVEAYSSLFSQSLSRDLLPSTISTAVPLIGMAFAFAVPLRAGVVNLGGDGQLVIGGVTATVVGLYAPLPGPLALVAGILAAMVAAGLLGALAAFMENRFGAPLIITSLLLSYPVVSIASYLARYPLNDKGTGVPQTKRLPDATHLPALGSDPVLNVGLLLLIAVVVVIYIVEKRTTLGFDVRMTGLNGLFASYAGINRAAMKTRMMFTGGAIAGLVGAILVMSPPYRFIDQALTSPGYTYTGLLAALLAGGSAIPVTIAGAFFAVLQTGGLGMERMTGVPNQLTAILQAVIIIFVTARHGLSWARRRKAEVPA